MAVRGREFKDFSKLILDELAEIEEKAQEARGMLEDMYDTYDYDVLDSDEEWN